MTLLRLRAIADFLSLLSQDIDEYTVEPFIKSRDCTILADAVSKGILPTAVSAWHCLSLTNNSRETVILSQGRLMIGGQGREWRLTAGQTRGNLSK